MEIKGIQNLSPEGQAAAMKCVRDAQIATTISNIVFTLSCAVVFCTILVVTCG
jgi:hypothetical protein